MNRRKTMTRRMNNNPDNPKATRRTRNMTLAPLAAMLFALIITACSSIDCPMDNLVYTQYQLMRADGKADTLSDTLTIYTNRHDGSDSVLINLQVGTKTLDLPISYAQPTDSFFFQMKDTTLKRTYTDTVTVSKVDKIHFESTDCGVSYFHTITSVNCTTNRIDSVRIINPDVSYDTSKKHFYIYFHSDL